MLRRRGWTTVLLVSLHCAAGTQTPAPGPPKQASFTIDASQRSGVVEPELYGHDLEFTRHDLWAGLSAQIIANRKFAVPSLCADKTFNCWPATIQSELGGLAPRWQKIGSPFLDTPLWAEHSSLLTGDVGHSVHCNSTAGAPCGVTQTGFSDGFDSGMSFGSAIVLESGREYSLRVVLKVAQQSSELAISASIDGGSGNMLNSSFTPAPNGEWQSFVVNFTSKATELNATFSVQASGEWWLGTVSLEPTASTWRGMRLDVIDKLKAIGFNGLFRYPGGCFAPFYRWKIGLLDPDHRPPIETPPGYCAAVPGGVNAYTDGMMENGISTDDFLALCEYLQMTPAITIRFQTGEAPEVQEAADWVEYLNGSPQSRWGALRAARGRVEPYNVTYWYLGNEISQQARYTNYPNDVRGIGPPSVAKYKQMLLNVVGPLLNASSTGPLRLLTVSASDEWNAAWVWLSHCVAPLTVC